MNPKQLEKAFDDLLEEKLAISKQTLKIKIRQFLKDEWKGFRYAKKDDIFKTIDTKVPKDKLLKVANKINTLPSDKHFFSKSPQDLWTSGRK